MSQNDNQNIRAFINSMISAITTGIVLSLIIIYSNYLFHKPLIVNIPNTSFEESEEDSNLSSNFSDSIIYSANNDFELSEKSPEYFPRESRRNISAKSYMVIDISSTTIILQKNQERLYPIASITKLITAIVAKKLIDKDQYITLNSTFLNTYGNEGRLRNGEKMRVGELFYPLLMVSSNDAAEAIAGSYPYGRQKFIKEMNDWVNSIGAYRTYFKDPTGLSPQNVSTAKDLIIIMKWIVENDPELLNITLTKSKTIRTHTWINPAHFLNLLSYIGGKNGYIPEANRTSLSAFKLGKQKHIFIVSVLGSSYRDKDVLDLLDESVR